MIEMPEAATIARQMNAILTGKTVTRFARGTQNHKFLWLNRPDEEHHSLVAGRVVTGADSFGRSIYLRLGEVMLWWGDAGGRILYLEPGVPLPKKYHLGWEFSDGSHLVYALEMWGMVKTLTASEFGERPNKESGIAPLTPQFTVEALNEMMDAYPEKTAKGIKGFLVATGYKVEKHINGLGNAIIQDVLFEAGIDPRRKIPELNAGQRHDLYDAIQAVISRAIELGGRDDEVDLFGNPGKYVRLMSSQTADQPCPECGTPIQKVAYLGGACYLCPRCQK
jgi:formamidopyrimidine-DNA glycosylase